MTTEFEDVVRSNLQDVLESSTKLHQCVFATGLACASRPESNSVETLPHIDYHTHHFIISFVFERLPNRRKLSMEPKLVNVDLLFIFELIRPFASVLVLRILPFRSDVFLEQMIVGLQAKIGASGDVVLVFRESRFQKVTDAHT